MERCIYPSLIDLDKKSLYVTIPKNHSQRRRPQSQAGLQINQRRFNIELNWILRFNQFNQLRARRLGNTFNLEVLIESS